MRYYIGLMSGTSLDGVDGVLTQLEEGRLKLICASYFPFHDTLYQDLLALQTPGYDEMRRASQVSNQLACLYADCVLQLLKKSSLAPEQITAIGVHGQTIRHLPDYGFSMQLNNPALLAELTGVDVVADFRSRDIAAGGQGAPLVPAFHKSLFKDPSEVSVVVNLGGIANITIIQSNGEVEGLDTGPGNLFMDAWMRQYHPRYPYDKNGEWAAAGRVHEALLNHLKDDAFFTLAPPKSTGRDLFHMDWLKQKLATYPDVPAVDVQATLCALTAHTLVDAIASYARGVKHVYLCGGGSYNPTLCKMIQVLLQEKIPTFLSLSTTESLGIAPNHVEAFAFAWFAFRHTERLAGNLPTVTGAAGERILGAFYPR